MMQRITVTRNPNALTRWQWTFWYDERRHRLVLDAYVELQRESNRHGFKVTQRYKRVMPRDVTIKNEADVVLYADVSAEAVRQFCASLTVGKVNE